MPISLIVGLGNPGNRYTETRHNAGFWLADQIARRYGAVLRADARFHGLIAEAVIGGRRLRILEPQTYVNQSGRSVAATARFYKIPADEIIVAHDDLDLPAGTVRVKRGGGHGGHNGLRDIIPALGSAEFVRVRLGIGHPGHRDAVVDHVLKPASREDRAAIDQAIDAVLDEVETLVHGEIDAVMNRLHRRSE
ncbi:MAG: aminoacyl-tRNA hydrolase [Chromatiales bacterium]|nr:aminoacyl-tRNA hydrolase [Chromatiales bacterium]